ncbi:MAG: hypothetical protein QMD43_06425 [Thermodesulfovibrio sp.]|jgi:hypothetical protein|nr:hypothetical protein [Thermodesulfovibrio sp.]
MNAQEYILSKQIQWARNHGINLVGSKPNRGRPAYTRTINENIFEPLRADVKKCFENGDGGELSGNPSKMQAVHSSSALCVNIFQYWINVNQMPEISYACGFSRKATKISQEIVFEAKYPIDEKFQYSPNIYVVIKNKPTSQYKVFAIECKFSEAYSNRGHSGIKDKYFDLNIWGDIPNLYKLARSISQNDDKFIHLHPAQIIKHVLGLKKEFGKSGFKLLYLWYDSLGCEGATHREEVESFAQIAASDNIHFHALSYQELIIRLCDEYRNLHKSF